MTWYLVPGIKIPGYRASLLYYWYSVVKIVIIILIKK
jgi:hypothetical protein